MTDEPIVVARGLGFSYGSRPILSEVDLTVGRGERIAILGPSGSGKSTLLRLIAGLERPKAGAVDLPAHPAGSSGGWIAPERRGMGLVFQDDALFPHLSVFDNVAFGVRRVPESERRDRVMSALASLGLADRAGDFPHRLSGGEQQRVAVARALAPRPGLILMDEPFSRLDSALRRQVREDVMSVLAAAGVGVVLVTHDGEEAMASADRLVLMANGRVLQTGRPRDVYRRPVSVEAGRLLGPMNALAVRVEPPFAHTPFGPIQAPGIAAGRAVLAFRPEALSIAADGLTAPVIARTYCGAETRAALRIGDDTVEMTTRASDAAFGTEVTVQLNRSDVLVLPEPGGR